MFLTLSPSLPPCLSPFVPPSVPVPAFLQLLSLCSSSVPLQLNLSIHRESLNNNYLNSITIIITIHKINEESYVFVYAATKPRTLSHWVLCYKYCLCWLWNGLDGVGSLPRDLVMCASFTWLDPTFCKFHQKWSFCYNYYNVRVTSLLMMSIYNNY